MSSLETKKEMELIAKYFFGLVVLASLLCAKLALAKEENKAANGSRVGISYPPPTTHHSPTYSIQLFSASTKEAAIRFLHSLDDTLQKEARISHSNDWYAVYFGRAYEPGELKEQLINFRKSGIKDAFLVKISKSANEAIKPPEKASLETIEKLVMQADEAYNRNDFSKSLELYEKAYLHEQEINNGAYRLLLETNLAYLLGRTGNIKKTKELIGSCQNRENFLYSTGLGLLEEGEFEAARGLLEEYLFEDKKGLMLLLLGVVYEKRDDLQRARLFYESAYSKNSLDPYFAYAYAPILG